MLRCPVCNHDLRAVDRDGVEIDVCPGCRGVWLDRGELEKLLARANNYRDDDDDDDSGQWRRPPSHPSGQGYPPKKKESLWSRMFDFD